MQSFNEQQVSAILKRAAALQAGEESVAHGLTLDELRSIAAEVGIDPRHVEQAAREAARPARPPEGFAWLGTAPRLTDERVLPYLVGEDAWSEMVEELRRTYGHVGTVAGAGSSRSWSFGNRRAPAAVTVSLTQRRGRTYVTAQRNLHQELAVTFGPGSSPLLVFTILIAAGQLLPMNPGLNLLVAAALFLTGFFAMRAIAGTIGRKEQRKMAGVLDRLEALAGDALERVAAEQTAESPALPASLLDLDAPSETASVAPTRARTR